MLFLNCRKDKAYVMNYYESLQLTRHAFNLDKTELVPMEFLYIKTMARLINIGLGMLIEIRLGQQGARPKNGLIRIKEMVTCVA